MTVTDGRVTRGERNREAIVDALLGCYDSGSLRPTVPEVAARAGVSVRSVHNHFVDLESLRAEVARRQWQRYASIIGPAATTNEFVAQRAALYEAITPLRRAALVAIYESPTIARALGHVDTLLRRHLEESFPNTTAPDTLDALELLASWDTWNRLRSAQGCSVTRARRIVTDLIRNLTEADLKKRGTTHDRNDA